MYMFFFNRFSFRSDANLNNPDPILIHSDPTPVYLNTMDQNPDPAFDLDRDSKEGDQ